ncbi:MAG: hypothetical protein JRG73_17965 [Deltaproteobacteria bacterium]|nr:hypothetical protein [Deltaproteobacteria bacterium]MBW2308812.1 hypothetical protein [Deltaproteobacteria bacterium]
MVTFAISPRLRGVLTSEAAVTSKQGNARTTRVFTPETLTLFDGKEGNPAYVGYQGKVFDMSSSPMWRNGLHMRQHLAGSDLTASMDSAPHDAEVLERFQEVGTILAHPPKPHERPRRRPLLVFYIMAYTNLALLIMVFLFVALWKRG